MLVQFQPPQLARDKLGSSSIVERVVSGSRPKTGQRGHSLRRHNNTQAPFRAMELTAPGGKATSAGGFLFDEIRSSGVLLHFFTSVLASGLGILLGDKKAGTFKLEMEWIKVRASKPTAVDSSAR